MRRVAVLPLVLNLASSAPNHRLATIDRRLTHLEEAQEDRKKQLDAIEARLAVLAVSLEAARGTEQAQDLAREIDELSTEVATLDAKVASGKPAAPARRAEPDPADVYAVAVAGSPTVGAADALVTIVRAYEYACPYCEKSRATMDELLQRYPKDVRIVYRSFIVHPQTATLAAEAACAAHRQGLFPAADQRLWDEAYAQRKYDQAEMELIATEIGADVDVFRADMSGACIGEVGQDQLDLKKVGVGATPTFYINGHYLSGAQPVTAFAAVVDQELALARSRLGKKITKKKRAKYYDTWVIAKGKTEFTAP
jgi:protein-disulfide isomerase